MQERVLVFLLVIELLWQTGDGMGSALIVSYFQM